jgi:hypothetical protein
MDGPFIEAFGPPGTFQLVRSYLARSGGLQPQ